MELTAGQALEILGKIISVNERMRTLLNGCATSGMYDDISDIQWFIFDDEDPITAHVKIALNCTDGVRIIEQIAKQAKENTHLAYYLDAYKILAELAELNQKIKRQDR